MDRITSIAKTILTEAKKLGADYAQCTVSESETACLGCAVFAAVGIGAFPSVSDAAGKLVRPDKRYVPSGADYEEAYRRFAALDEKMNQVPKGN